MCRCCNEAVAVTRENGPVSLSVKHLFVCLVWWMKQTRFYSDVLNGLDSDLRLSLLLSVSCYLHTHMWIFGDLLYTLSCSRALVSVMLSTVVCLPCASSYLLHLLVSTFLLMYWVSFTRLFCKSLFIFFFLLLIPSFVAPSQSMARCTSTCCLTQQSETLWADAASLQSVKLANA